MNALTRVLHVALAPALALAGLALVPVPGAAQTLRHGPFEIVAQSRRISAGGFPNTSGNPFRTTEVTEFAVRWQGQPVTVPKVGARFWRVLRLADAPQPALLVSTTDFHLVTERDGRLDLRSLGPASTGGVALQWLDGADGQPGPTRQFGIERLALDEGTVWRGGRWLRIGHHTVLDVQTLQAYPVVAWIPSGSGQPLQGLNASTGAARAFSPGQTRFVLVGTGQDPQRDPGDYDGLVVVDIPSGQAEGVRLDRRRTRYAEAHDIDAAWIVHHFQWQRDAAGREQLLPRSGAPPWPWRGRLLDFGGGRVEYRVPRMAPAFAGVVERVAVERLQAQPGVDGADRALRVPGCEHPLVLTARPAHVGVHVAAPTGSPGPRCQDALRRLAAAVDGELAGGRHDGLVVLD
jgi:hypothetical protein